VPDLQLASQPYGHILLPGDRGMCVNNLP